MLTLSLLCLALLRLLLRALRLLGLLLCSLLFPLSLRCRGRLGRPRLRGPRRLWLPLRRCASLPTTRCSARLQSLVSLLRDGFTRTVMIVLFLDHYLLSDLLRVAVPRVLLLINRQRGRRRHRTAVPAIPSDSTLFPRATPMLAPARRLAHDPRLEIGRRPAV